MQIRKILPTDASGVYEVVKNTWLQTYPNTEFGITQDDILQKFADKNKYVNNFQEKLSQDIQNKNWWVCIINSQVVWVFLSQIIEEKLYLKVLYVMPDFQWIWVWKALINIFFENYKDYNEIYLWVAVYNTKAINFYKKYWFEIIPWSESFHKIAENKSIPNILMKK